MLDAADRFATSAASTLPERAECDAPQLRPEISGPDDYAIDLPEWLRQCIEHVPPGQGETCPTDPEGLLASAFDFAYQLHRQQVRATGEPYIIHPVAVADLLRDIGASAAVIAAGFLHDVVEDTDVSLEEIKGTSARRCGNWWRASPSWAASISPTELRPKLKICARCFWRWPATSAWCW